MLKLNYSRLLAAKRNARPILFLNVVVLPVFFGSILVILTTFPLDIDYQSIRLVSILPILMSMFLGLGLYKAKHISLVKGGLNPVPKILLVVLIVGLLISRLGLMQRIEPLW